MFGGADGGGASSGRPKRRLPEAIGTYRVGDEQAAIKRKKVTYIIGTRPGCWSPHLLIFSEKVTGTEYVGTRT